MSRSEVWKYPLSAEDVTEVDVPEGARFLSVQVQNGWLCAWALVDPEAAKVPVVLALVGTGIAFDPSRSGDYFGTVQVGQFVFHAFARLGRTVSP